MHRCAFLAFLPAVLGCANPDTDSCASYIASNAATASAFCATFTQSVVTDTAGLPSWASACDNKPSHISKECSCYYTAGAAVATSAAAADTTEAAAVTTEAAPVTTEAAVETSEAVFTTSVRKSATTAVATPVASSAAASASDGASCGSASVDELVGYAAGTTGGGSGTGVTVTSCSALEDAVQDGGVIKVSGILSDCGVIDVSSDSTIIGVGSDSGLTGGGFNAKGVTNVIFRNLKMHDAPEGEDLIGIDDSTYVWVDHCDFSSEGLTGDKDYYDGLLDLKHAADFVTVSWNKFYDHWKASLVGHSDSNSAEDTGHLRVTYHHNYWNNINSRTPSIRFGTGHIYSSCYEDIPTSGVHSRMGAKILVEQCSFTDVKRAIITNLDSDEDGYAVQKNNIFTDSDISITQSEDFTPPYTYTTDPASCICDLLSSQAGTGVVG